MEGARCPIPSLARSVRRSDAAALARSPHARSGRTGASASRGGACGTGVAGDAWGVSGDVRGRKRGVYGSYVQVAPVESPTEIIIRYVDENVGLASGDGAHAPRKVTR
jgi:hypothetical protein